jgi:hypothetical protein
MKYNVGDVFIIPHYDGHYQPLKFTIKDGFIKKVKLAITGIDTEMICYSITVSGTRDKSLCMKELYEIDIEHQVQTGDYLYYPVAKSK